MSAAIGAGPGMVQGDSFIPPRLSTREDRSHSRYLSAGTGVTLEKEEDSDPDDDVPLVQLDKLRRSKRPNSSDFVTSVIDLNEDISSEDTSGDDYRPEQVEESSDDEEFDDEPPRKKKAGGRALENSEEAKIRPDMFDRRKVGVGKEQKKDWSKGAVSADSIAVEVLRAVQPEQTGLTASLPPQVSTPSPQIPTLNGSPFPISQVSLLNPQATVLPTQMPFPQTQISPQPPQLPYPVQQYDVGNTEVQPGSSTQIMQMTQLALQAQAMQAQMAAQLQGQAMQAQAQFFLSLQAQMAVQVNILYLCFVWYLNCISQGSFCSQLGSVDSCSGSECAAFPG